MIKEPFACKVLFQEAALCHNLICIHVLVNQETEILHSATETQQRSLEDKLWSKSAHCYSGWPSGIPTVFSLFVLLVINIHPHGLKDMSGSLSFLLWLTSVSRQTGASWKLLRDISRINACRGPGGHQEGPHSISHRLTSFQRGVQQGSGDAKCTLWHRGCRWGRKKKNFLSPHPLDATWL